MRQQCRMTIISSVVWFISTEIWSEGVVNHPSEWPFSGYNEIQEPPQKYSLIDRRLLMTLLGIDNSDRLSKAYKG